MIRNYKKKFDLQNKLAFVAGGQGYIGNEIVNALVSMNCRVVVLDIYRTKRNKNKKIQNEYVDLSKTFKLEKFFICAGLNSSSKIINEIFKLIACSTISLALPVPIK